MYQLLEVIRRLTSSMEVELVIKSISSFNNDTMQVYLKIGNESFTNTKYIDLNVSKQIEEVCLDFIRKQLHWDSIAFDFVSDPIDKKTEIFYHASKKEIHVNFVCPIEKLFVEIIKVNIIIVLLKDKELPGKVFDFSIGKENSPGYQIFKDGKLSWIQEDIVVNYYAPENTVYTHKTSGLKVLIANSCISFLCSENENENKNRKIKYFFMRQKYKHIYENEIREILSKNNVDRIITQKGNMYFIDSITNKLAKVLIEEGEFVANCNGKEETITYKFGRVQKDKLIFNYVNRKSYNNYSNFYNAVQCILSENDIDYIIDENNAIYKLVEGDLIHGVEISTYSLLE
jgi:flagellar basal body-associated protein FliL